MIDAPFKAISPRQGERKASVSGPGEGMPLEFSSWTGALDAAHLANFAYHLGEAHAKADIREALGIK